jgi:arsenate reductase
MNHINNFLKLIGAINDETRLKILAFISINTKVCVCDIENSFEMIQSRVSRHLKILKESGLLEVKRDGRWAYYSLKSDLGKFELDILDEIKSLNIDIPALKHNCKAQNHIKNILILCTGNSCRSIIAEALINFYLEDIQAYSSGVSPSGKVNPNAKKVLVDNGIWKDEYHSKTLEELDDIEFDLVITVCNQASANCPIFKSKNSDKKTKIIHIGFEDPDTKPYSEFVKTYEQIKSELLPQIKNHL